MRPIEPGDMLHGACMGIFGNRHHACTAVEAVGVDWIVGRPINNDWFGKPMGDTAAVFGCGHHVLVEAVRNRDGGLQDGCKSSFESGCSYDYNYDPNN